MKRHATLFVVVNAMLALGCGKESPAITQESTCGNGQIEPGEECDGEDLNGKSCLAQGFSTGALHCTSRCKLDTAACTAIPRCGDGRVDSGEACDGADLDGHSCVDAGFESGDVACTASCALDTSACVAYPNCGNGAVDDGEACDGANLNGKSCVTEGFVGGTLSCTRACRFETSGCRAHATCGDALAEGPEACDGADLKGQTCRTLGLYGGALGCAADCTAFDTSACAQSPICGDDVADGSEVCDGADLREKTCQKLGFYAGTLACASDCKSLDLSGCTAMPTCGNFVAEDGEVCDRLDLRGETCASRGFARGTLACSPDCHSFDTRGCLDNQTCGNDLAEGTEPCDGTDLKNKTCFKLGYSGGALACAADCTAFDTHACTTTPICGNGRTELGENCDTTDLLGETCQTQGYSGGTLTCTANCRSLVLSGCTGLTCGVTQSLGSPTPVSQTGSPTTNGGMLATINLNTDPDKITVELVSGKGVMTNGVATGTYTLSGPDLDYATCGLCLTLTDNLGKQYLANGGSVTLTSVTGRLTGTLTSVSFGEVSISASSHTASPVGGGCLTVLASMAFDANIAVWTCSMSWYGTSDGCDCGCGVVDPDCANATAAACGYCPASGCAAGAGCSAINPTNNAICGP